MPSHSWCVATSPIGSCLAKRCRKTLSSNVVSEWFLGCPSDDCVLFNCNAGWWFGTWILRLSIQLGIKIIPTDFHSIIFQRDRSTTNQNGTCSNHLEPTHCRDQNCTQKWMINWSTQNRELKTCCSGQFPGGPWCLLTICVDVVCPWLLPLVIVGYSRCLQDSCYWDVFPCFAIGLNFQGTGFAQVWGHQDISFAVGLYIHSSTSSEFQPETGAAERFEKCT